MTKYREILRLSSQGVSKRGIAASCHCSRNTITAIMDRVIHNAYILALDSKKSMREVMAQNIKTDY